MVTPEGGGSQSISEVQLGAILHEVELAALKRFLPWRHALGEGGMVATKGGSNVECELNSLLFC